MTRTRRSILHVWAAAAALCVLVGWRAAPQRPRLVVMLVVDQMRGDYVETYRDR